MTLFPPGGHGEPYQNLSGDSGVTYYEIGTESVAVQFRNGSIYVYDYTRPGPLHVERLKELAIAGRGLSTYISTRVRNAYARKAR
ncbi:MAG: hypothetical protein HY700_04315 [Gemmatimonadetes bacterium]|nr:hypothetical protein [Gemmatimonadota bacterium]